MCSVYYITFYPSDGLSEIGWTLSLQVIASNSGKGSPELERLTDERPCTATFHLAFGQIAHVNGVKDEPPNHPVPASVWSVASYQRNNRAVKSWRDYPPATPTRTDMHRYIIIDQLVVYLWMLLHILLPVNCVHIDSYRFSVYHWNILYSVQYSVCNR